MFPVDNRDYRNANPYQEAPNRNCCGPNKAGPTQGNLLVENTVEYANEQTSKTKPWFIVAIVVGSLVVIGVGGFGVLGLVQTYGAVSLPQWLASAIGTIGNTPHAWGLWVMGAGGIVVGGGLVTGGSVKMHQIRKTEEKFKKFQENRDHQETHRAARFPEYTIFDIPEKRQ